MSVHVRLRKWAGYVVLGTLLSINLALWLLWPVPLTTWRAFVDEFAAAHRNPSLVGKTCPDLPLLVCDNSSGQSIEATTCDCECTSLSHLRGDQVVCLFLSSFT